MKIIIIAAALILCTAAMTVKPNSTHARRAVCTRYQRALKVWADPQRFKVNANPINTSLGAVNRIRRPSRQPSTRNTFWMQRVWQVKAQIVEFRYDFGRGSLRFVLYLDNNYMNAVVPIPSCLLPKTRQNLNIQKVWGFFTDHCSRTPTSQYQSLGAVVVLRGVGYWQKDFFRGSARNGAELSPVTGMQVLAGCGT